MATPLLKGIDGDSVLDFVLVVEESFGLTFGETELNPVSTFGEFCTVVLAKLPTAGHSDCTSQQAFYKLRQALATHVPVADIVPNALLADLLPNSRKQQEEIIEAVETTLGFPLYLTGIANWAGNVLFSAFVFSLIGFLYRWQAGVAGLLLTAAGGYLLGRFCQVPEVSTIREVVEKMTREHYRQLRRDPATANRREIVEQLQALFHHELGIAHHRLTPAARF
jgi:hypothetical protein